MEPGLLCIRNNKDFLYHLLSRFLLFIHSLLRRIHRFPPKHVHFTRLNTAADSNASVGRAADGLELKRELYLKEKKKT